MSRFRSIRLKIVAPLALFILIVAIFNSIYFPSKEADRINAIFQQRLEISLATLVLGTSISISSGNLEGAEATVNLLKEDEHLTFLMVLDDEGSELIRHGTLA